MLYQVFKQVQQAGVMSLEAHFEEPTSDQIQTVPLFAEGPERNKAMGVWAAIATGGARSWSPQSVAVAQSTAKSSAVASSGAVRRAA